MTLNEMLFLSTLMPVCAALIALIYFSCKSQLNEHMRRYLFRSVCCEEPRKIAEVEPRKVAA